MVMGKVSTHPDASLLPFSYIIGDGRKTYLIPGRNICTVGLYRDVTKWPKRDSRPQSCRKSLITYDWLSPYVIERVKAGMRCLEAMREEQGYGLEEYEGNGFIITAKALAAGLEYYDLALRMYGNAGNTSNWTDLLGLITPTDALDQIHEDIINGDINDINTLESRFADIYHSYEQWKGFSDNENVIEQAHTEWLDAIRRDAEREYDMGDVSHEQLTDFISSLK